MRSVSGQLHQTWVAGVLAAAHHAKESQELRDMTLKSFLRGNVAKEFPGCANLDEYYGGCLYRETCLLDQGKRCQYFEQAVMPTARDAGCLEQVTEQYNRKTGSTIRRKVRPCPDCGGELKPRRRYCEACAKKRRRQVKRTTARKLRSNVDS